MSAAGVSATARAERRRTDDAKVFVETVADEDAAEIDEEAELLVGDLERDEGVPTEERVEVASADARVLGQEVDDGLACVDVVVDERDACVHAVAAEDGHTREGHARRSEDILRPVGSVLDVFLLQRDEFGVDGDERPRLRQLGRLEQVVRDARVVAPAGDADVGEEDRCVRSRWQMREVEDIGQVDAGVVQDGGDLQCQLIIARFNAPSTGPGTTAPRPRRWAGRGSR